MTNATTGRCEHRNGPTLFNRISFDTNYDTTASWPTIQDAGNDLLRLAKKKKKEEKKKRDRRRNLTGRFESAALLPEGV
jgi:hypothetical protein